MGDTFYFESINIFELVVPYYRFIFILMFLNCFMHHVILSSCFLFAFVPVVG